MFEQIYKDLSTSLPEHLDLIKCEPNYVIHYHDGESLELSTDRVRLRKEVERFEGESGGEGLEGFLAWVHLILILLLLRLLDR
jgi:phytoene desaturase (3,4-didehydrolycopene-forming)